MLTSARVIVLSVGLHMGRKPVLAWRGDGDEETPDHRRGLEANTEREGKRERKLLRSPLVSTLDVFLFRFSADGGRHRDREYNCSVYLQGVILPGLDAGM